MVKQPFEVPFSEVLLNPAPYVDAVLGCLASEFWVMPKGNGFVDYPTFDAGYEKLKQATKGFRDIATERVLKAVIECPISFVVLRAMLGFHRRNGPMLQLSGKDLRFRKDTPGPLTGTYGFSH